MTLAETASIFCETLVVEEGLQRLTGRDRLALLDVELETHASFCKLRHPRDHPGEAHIAAFPSVRQAISEPMLGDQRGPENPPPVASSRKQNHLTAPSLPLPRNSSTRTTGMISHVAQTSCGKVA